MKLTSKTKQLGHESGIVKKVMKRFNHSNELKVQHFMQGLCWSVLGREAEVESLACEVGLLLRVLYFSFTIFYRTMYL
jgi:hypothetical protein